MKRAEEIASEIVDGLHFSSNRMVNGRLVGEQHFAADAIARAIKLDRLQMAGTITMNEIRLRTGEGRLSYGTILWAVNKILSERATPTVNGKGE